jgi:hypothetical protein
MSSWTAVGAQGKQQYREPLLRSRIRTVRKHNHEAHQFDLLDGLVLLQQVINDGGRQRLQEKPIEWQMQKAHLKPSLTSI